MRKTRHVVPTRSRRPFRFVAPCFVALSLLLLAAAPALAGWENPAWALVFEPPAGNVRDVTICTDAQGGMLAAMYDRATTPLRVRVSRIDHAGTEIWGNGGVAIPFNLGSDSMAVPIDLAPDGSGGAYVAYCEAWGSDFYVAVDHIRPDGSFDWRALVANAGNPGGWGTLEIQIESTGDGEAIVGWTHAVLGASEVQAARIGATGAVLWQRDLLPTLAMSSIAANWYMVSDGRGGVIVQYYNYDSPTGFHRYVQRISGGGTFRWGANGRELTGVFASQSAMVHDGNGGAYFSLADLVNGRTVTQRVDSLGTTVWGTGHVVLDRDANPLVCSDGLGGFYLAEQDADDIFAQHVDANGTVLWGTSGIAAASQAGTQVLTSIAPDGANGALVGYVDWYFVDIGGTQNRVPSGVRLDWFGNKIWEMIGLWFEGWGDAYEPYDVIAVADGSGGALFGWNEQNAVLYADSVYAIGVNASGDYSRPMLTYVAPDAGAPGDVGTVYILGDYLEAGNTFTLHRSGSPDLPITGNSFLSYQLIAGTLDLTGADPGAYDLLAASNYPADTLWNAFGVGTAPPCSTDQAVPTFYATVVPDEGTRKAAVDANGDVHAVWTEFDGSLYWLEYLAGDPASWTGPPGGILGSSFPMTHPSVAVGPDGTTHITFVLKSAGSSMLYYVRIDPQGTIVLMDFFADTVDKWEPTIAVTPDSVAHIVFGYGPSGATDLYYVTHDDASFSPPQNLNAGFNDTEPDLTVADGGLMLTFVRNFWLPGFREVCSMRYPAGGPWDPVIGIYWGVYVFSPSVAWDGGNKILFAWILDNTGTDPLLHTCLMESYVHGPVRWRVGEPQVTRTIVASEGPDRFLLLTEENGGSLPMVLNLREGDGNVFYPKRRVNGHDDVDLPALASQTGGPGAFVIWQDYQNGAEPLFQWHCSGGVQVEVAEGAPPALPAGPFARPNPFNPSTTISFRLPESGRVELAVYDVRGRLVRTLLEGVRPAGEESVVWDGTDNGGAPLSSGVYFVRLTRGNDAQATKVVLVK